MNAYTNDFKVLFVNAYDMLRVHAKRCADCTEYIEEGDGDLCDTGKAIIKNEMGLIEFSPITPSMDAPQ